MLDTTSLENPRQHAGKLVCACPACREEGRDKAGCHLAVFESGAYRCAADDSQAHRRRIFEMIGARQPAGHAAPPPPVARRPVAAKPQSRPAPCKPRLPALRPLNAAEMARIAEHRKWPSTAGLELLTGRGLLWHGRVWDGGAEYGSWIVTDSARLNAQARRLDGLPWNCGKAKTLPGSLAGRPVGLDESRPFPRIMLCEGGPDFLAALLVAWWHGYAATVAPIAIFGAGLSIPADALHYFAGKEITLCQHADTGHASGQDAAQRWAAQLRAAGAASVHFAGFAQVRMVGGRPCKDLADFATTLPPPAPPHNLCPAFQRPCELAPLGGERLRNLPASIAMNPPRRKQRTRAFDCARAMPPLTHWRDLSQPWTPAQSDVVAWLAAQPKIASYILNKAAGAGVITYDETQGLWRGVDRVPHIPPPV